MRFEYQLKSPKHYYSEATLGVRTQSTSHEQLLVALGVWRGKTQDILHCYPTPLKHNAAQPLFGGECYHFLP